MLNRHPLAASALILCISAAAFSADPPAQTKPGDEATVEITDPELQKKIDAAIDKAANWLKKQQLPDGAFPGLNVEKMSLYPGLQGKPYDHQLGLTALALLALVKAKVPSEDPAIQNGLAWIRANIRKPVDTYDAATICMLVEAVHRSMDEKGKKKKKTKPKTPPQPKVEMESDDNGLEQMAQNLLQWQKAHGGWRYGSHFSGGSGDAGDVSVTQYALMALLSAKRMGVLVDPKSIERAAEWLLTQQEPAGTATYQERARGFAYLKDGKSEVPSGRIDTDHLISGTMTCAGTVGLLICREILSESVLSKKKKNKDHPLLPKLTQGIRDALAWLDANWSIDFHQPGGLGIRERGYYLYGLERVGMLAGISRIGEEHSWYAEGAKFWVENQKEDGSWEVSHGRPLISGQDTPYGILFLSKATVKLNYNYTIGEEKNGKK